MRVLAKDMSGFVVAALVAVAGAPLQAATITEAERAQICREAADRYKQIFGKAPGEEPFVVVLMFRDNYCPRELTVKQGTTLRWVNVDKRTSHSVWFKEAGQAESDRVFPEEAITMMIDWPPGEYTYLCGPHWEKEAMIGRLTVMGR